MSFHLYHSQDYWVTEEQISLITLFYILDNVSILRSRGLSFLTEFIRSETKPRTERTPTFDEEQSCPAWASHLLLYSLGLAVGPDQEL